MLKCQGRLPTLISQQFFLVQFQIWSGDLKSKKPVTVVWNIMCTHIAEGCLGLTSLSKLNEPSNLKVCREIFHFENHWANFL